MKKKYFCKEPRCNNEICKATALYGKGRCQSCAIKGELSGNYIDGRTLKTYHCKDCGEKLISYTAKRCRKCAGKIHSKRMKGKIYNKEKYKKYYCKEPNCNNEICYDTWKFGKGRCMSCGIKKAYKMGILNSKDSNNNNFKGDKAVKNKIYYCIESDCKNKICYKNWKEGNRRCKSCAYSGKRHHNYINGKSKFPYPLKFNQKLRDKIRARDNFTCQNCSMTEKEHIIVCGWILSVHHIDYDKKNCKKENLISLCLSCNVRANYNRKYWENYYKEKLNNVNSNCCS